MFEELRDLDEIYSYIKINFFLYKEEKYNFYYEELDKFSPNFSKAIKLLPNEIQHSVNFI
jgi:hypothetical protein